MQKIEFFFFFFGNQLAYFGELQNIQLKKFTISYIL